MDAGCPTHDNCIGNSCSGDGLGQTYSSPCQPLGVPGNDATYSQAMAEAAGGAAAQPPVTGLCALSQGQCTGTATCGSGTAANVYFLDDSDNLAAPYCYVWEFATGGTSGSHTYESGHVYASLTACSCPYSTDPTWN